MTDKAALKNSASNDEAIDWLRKIESAKILDNKSVMDLFLYGEYSLWWYLDLPLYYRIKRVLLRSDHNKKYGKLGLHSRLRHMRLFLQIRACFAYLYLVVKSIVRFIYGSFVLSVFHRRSMSSILILSSSYSWRATNRSCAKNTSRLRYKDEMVGNIIECLLEHKNTVIACDVHEEFPPGVGMKKLIEKNILQGSVWRPIESYLSLKVIKKTLIDWSYYNKIGKRIIKSARFRNLFHIDGSDRYNSFDDVINNFISYQLFEIILHIHLINRAVEAENVKVILTNCDHCRFGRTALFSAKMCNLPAISVQMAIISENSREYIYTAEEMRTLPLADTYAVNGEYTYDILTKKGTYSADKVKIVGQPRYDHLINTDLFDRDAFCIINGINPDHKIVLVTLQPVNMELSEEPRSQLLKYIENELCSLENIDLLIKPHPREKDLHYLKRFEKMPNIHVLRPDSNTYDAINACDVLTTISSTTALEAMVLQKVVIIINTTGVPEHLPFVRSGAAIGVFDMNKLKKTLIWALYDKSYYEPHLIASKRFVYQQLYLQDGLASQRVLDLIKPHL